MYDMGNKTYLEKYEDNYTLCPQNIPAMLNVIKENMYVRP